MQNVELMTRSTNAPGRSLAVADDRALFDGTGHLIGRVSAGTLSLLVALLGRQEGANRSIHRLPPTVLR